MTTAKIISTQIIQRNERLNPINHCLKNMDRLGYAVLKIEIAGESEAREFALATEQAKKLLLEMKRYEEKCLDELKEQAAKGVAA